MNKQKFQDSPAQNEPDAEQNDLLSRKISDLKLQIQGSCLEERINQLYQELEKGGMSFRPKTYLSDEWGCPHGVPVIGIPFYLSDPGLCQLETKLSGIETETETEIMMFLRHEAGHAFNYAYRLYLKRAWRKIFGKFSLPYQEVYKPVPFNSRFVRHVPGWYAQKHPDDDFAETFAVWLTPGSNWLTNYADTPALIKLQYIDQLVSQYGRKPPVVLDEIMDKPLSELTMTLDSWYSDTHDYKRHRLVLPSIIDQHLRHLFTDTEGEMAADLLSKHQSWIMRDINNWTGLDRHLLESLCDELTHRTRSLELKFAPPQTTQLLFSLAVFMTTLAMNYQHSGQFIET